MSQEPQAEQSTQVQIPEDVQKIKDALDAFLQYRRCVESGTYPAAQAESVVALRKALLEMYGQVHAQLTSHPFVIEYNKKASEEAAKRQAEAQASAEVL